MEALTEHCKVNPEKGVSECDSNWVKLPSISGAKGAFSGLLELASGGQVADMNIRSLAASIQVGLD